MPLHRLEALLGTFIAACQDENGFNMHMLAIGIAQLLVWYILKMIPIIGVLANIPNWIYGIVIAARICYYNYIRLQGEESLARKERAK